MQPTKKDNRIITTNVWFISICWLIYGLCIGFIIAMFIWR